MDKTARAARRLAVVDHAERVAGLGSWEWVPATGELHWSDNLFRLYGLEPGVLQPSIEYITELVHPAERPQFEATLGALSAGERRNIEYRITTAGGETRMLNATVAAIETAPGPRRLVGSVLDLTDRRQLEREVALRVGVTQALERWSAFPASANLLLEAMARALDFDFGAFWLREAEHFTVRAIWHLPGPELDALAAETHAWHPGLGSPTIGGAVTTRQPVITPNVQASAPPRRRAAMRAAGIGCAIAVPALDGVVAVIELLGRGPIDMTDALRRALDGTEHEIASFLARHRADLVEQMLSDREVAVLCQAARGSGTREIAAALHLSPATVKRHFERVAARLGTRSRTASVAEALRRGLIT